MNAYKLNILIHYSYKAVDFQDGNSTAIRDALQDLQKDYLIVLTDKSANTRTTYELTVRGRIYVEALLRVPLPVQAWTMPAPYGDDANA